MRQLAKLLKRWRRVLRLHPDFEITLLRDTSDEHKAAVDTDKIEYGRATVSFSETALRERNRDLESDLVHELLHVVLHPLVSAAQVQARSEKDEEYLSRLEERVVCQLETALIKLSRGET